jgi:plastocyanin
VSEVRCRDRAARDDPVRLRELAALASFVALACSHSDSGPPPRGPVTPLDPATAGAIEGTVLLDGTPPASARVAFTGDPACVTAQGERLDVGDVLVRDGRVANAFVYLARGLEGRVFARPTRAVTIDQSGCLYVPRVAGAQTGQAIEFVNSDPTLHNVHLEPKRSSGTNFGMAVQGARRSMHIDVPEAMITVRCEVHPWMRAYLGVLDHPYFAVTSPDGSFRLGEVPAGDYTMAVWHERLGVVERSIGVTPQRVTRADVRFGGVR